MAARLETGVMNPEGDWPGIFIRGDDALAYANRLRSLFAELETRAKAGEISEEEISAWAKLNDLAICWNRAGLKTNENEPEPTSRPSV
jgi:hypothetical protein